jgi:hypothetical protein
MTDGLKLRDNAKADLMQIKSIEDGVTYLNKLESVAIWVMKEKKDAELSNLVAEQKLRTQRILGELIKVGQENGEIATAGNPDKFNSAKREELKSVNKIEDIGLTHKQSSNFKAIADIPEEQFEEFIAEKKEAVNNAVAELTTAGAVRLSKSLKEKREDLDTISDINSRLDTERELRNLAKELRLVESFNVKHLICPIIVNEKMQVIDGQHRLQASRETGSPVHYIVVAGYGIEEVQRLNNNQKNWTKADFLEMYCAQGVRVYLEFKDFSNAFPELGFQACERILTGFSSGKRTGHVGGKKAQMMDFQEGKLTIPNLGLSWTSKITMKDLIAVRLFQLYCLCSRVRTTIIKK